MASGNTRVTGFPARCASNSQRARRSARRSPGVATMHPNAVPHLHRQAFRIREREAVVPARFVSTPPAASGRHSGNRAARVLAQPALWPGLALCAVAWRWRRVAFQCRVHHHGRFRMQPAPYLEQAQRLVREHFQAANGHCAAPMQRRCSTASMVSSSCSENAARTPSCSTIRPGLARDSFAEKCNRNDWLSPA